VLRIRGLAVGYGGEPVLDAIDLDVQAGQFVSLIGPSGSGKTSILRAVTGLVPAKAGTVTLDLPPDQVAFLFQDDALLPWRTVRQNAALGLRIRGASREVAEEQAASRLSVLGLDRFLDRYPRQLSSGQRKRVALAQVFVLGPRLLLMDEPFASLDAMVRMKITEELLGWVEREQLAVLLVTHDLEEALTLSDTVYVLSRGPRATIRARLDVAIERPRHVIETRAHPQFGALLGRLWQLLSEEGGPPALGEVPR
jgi:NitT/TauT family transport system ATP-binding protein